LRRGFQGMNEGDQGCQATRLGETHHG
jgi:hypothetical protein